MNWLLSIVISLLTGACGVGAGLLVGTLNVRWFRVSSLEGNSGFLTLGLGLFGGVVGLVTGLVVARLVAAGAHPSFLKGLGAAVSSLAALTGIVAGLCWLAADEPPTIDGRELQLVVEVRAPRHFPSQFPRDEFGSYLHLQNGAGKTVNSVELPASAPRQEEDRGVFPVTLRLNTRSSGKRLRAYFNREADVTFDLPLRGCPRLADCAWSPWIPASASLAAGAASVDPFLVRYRVEVDDPPAPVPTAAEREAQFAAEQTAAIEAVSPDAPITGLLQFTGLEHPEDLRAAAMKRIQARPHFAAELAAIIASADIRDVSAALRTIGQLDAFPPELHAAVATGGRRLNAWSAAWSAAQQSPDVVAPDEYAIGGCSRHWLEAVRVLRTRAGGDFSAEFAAFLRESREQDYPALRAWGGFPPEPETEATTP